MATVGIREAAGPSIPVREKSTSTARRTSLNLVGFWAAALTGLWTVWFIAAFGPWIASQASWKGIDAFAASFQALPYLAWVLPCLLLALTFPVCCHRST